MREMKKRNRRKLEKKRRAKRAQHAARSAPLVYTGNKYRTDELVQTHLAAETAIYEAFVITDRTLTDGEVRSALEKMIPQMRSGTLPALEEMSEREQKAFGVEEFIISNIRSHWQQLFANEPNPGRDKLAGVLRSILGSIDFRGSRGYLEFIEEFLNEVGIRVETRPVPRS